MTDTSERWSAVSAFLRKAMAEAGGLTQRELVDRSGVSRETIRPLLDGKPGNYRASTLTKIAIALGKPPDSFARVLAGETPEVTEPVTPHEAWVALQAELAELRARLEALEQAAEPPSPDTPDDEDH